MYRALAIVGLAFFLAVPLPAADVPAQPTVDPQAVRAHYEQVLAAPEYQEKPEIDLLSQLGQWFYSLLRSLNQSMDQFNYGPQVANLSYFMMWLILILSFLGIIYWIGKSLWLRHGDGETHGQRPQGERYFASPESFDAEIAGAIRARDWPAALLWSWRRLLAQLERHELVAADRTQTNWEYLAQLRWQSVPAPASESLARLARAYDLHIYGQRPLSPDEWNGLAGEFQSTVRVLKLDRPSGVIG